LSKIDTPPADAYDHWCMCGCSITNNDI